MSRSGNGMAFAILFLLAFNTLSSAADEEALYTFCSAPDCLDGRSPNSGVVFDNSGNLYGTANAGGAGFGVVFSLTPQPNGNWTEDVLYAFSGFDDGDAPSGVVFDKLGNLFGTTVYGGGAGTCTNGGCGTVFELTKVGSVWMKSTLYRFSGGKDGGVPLANLILDSHGNIYGTTSIGGAYGLGSVFALIRTQTGWTEKVIHSFAGGNDGSTPMAGLTFDNNGHLFGTTTMGGGPSNGGTLFMLARTGTAVRETILHRFTGSDGDGSVACSPLTFDEKGNLYGSTGGGGANFLGTVFRFSRTKSGIRETILLSFSGSGDGFGSCSGITVNATGDLYGTTFFGGPGGDGSAFALKNSGGTWTETILYSFSGLDGSGPLGSLVLDSAGNLYGTTALGGSNGMGAGNVFEVMP